MVPGRKRKGKINTHTHTETRIFFYQMRSNGFTTLTWVFELYWIWKFVLPLHMYWLQFLCSVNYICYIKAKDFSFNFDNKLLWFQFLSPLPPCDHLSPSFLPCNHLFFSLSCKKFISIPNYIYIFFLSHSFLLGRLLEWEKRYYYNLIFF